ncbi:MAG: hypothetical protein AMXMBFR23_14010 [Chloroflexota bacterium]
MDRHFDFEQVFNFRDLGGYDTADGRTVRWRRLFRSGEHQRMRPHEVKRLRAEITIRTVIDFRSETEAGDPRGPGALVAPGVERHHLPMGNADAKFAARSEGAWDPDYVGMLRRQGPAWAQAFSILGRDEAYPAVFHCVTGKDRTGVFAALLLDALGVPEPVILDDFALSQRAMDTLVERLRARGVMRPDETPNPALGVPREAMAEMLAVLRGEHGSARAYLRAHGVSDATFNAVEVHLLEPRR